MSMTVETPNRAGTPSSHGPGLGDERTCSSRQHVDHTEHGEHPHGAGPLSTSASFRYAASSMLRTVVLGGRSTSAPCF